MRTQKPLTNKKKDPSTYSKETLRINKCIAEYRDGDSKYGEELVNMFQPMINKYKVVLLEGRRVWGSDINHFLSFFGKDKKQAAELLAKSLNKHSEEDIVSLLKYCLLKTALKYNKISSGYKYIVKEEVAKLTRDICSYRTTVTVDFTEDYLKLPEDTSIVEHLSPENSYKSSNLSEFLNLGSTLPGFSDLEEWERHFIYDVYIERLTNKELSEKYNFLIKEITEQRARIKKIMEDAYPELAAHKNYK